MHHLPANALHRYGAVVHANCGRATNGAPCNPEINPLRRLGPITAASKDTVSRIIVARGLSNASVLVGVFPNLVGWGKREVKLVDSTLQHSTVVRDTSEAAQLIRFTADSTLTLDIKPRTLLVLDPLGKVARVMALPKTQDFANLQGFTRTPKIDPKGRIVYQGVTPDPQPQPGVIRTPFQPDSAPIVRGDFESRTVDTIATIKIVVGSVGTIAQDGQNVSIKVVFNPASTADEWTMLSDGTIAIVRAQDYLVDWVDPDGSRGSIRRMPFDWKRITDAQKQFTIDSMKPTLDSLTRTNPSRTLQGPDGPLKVSWQFDVLPPDKLPDYEPPIAPGSVRADLNGNLWIVPRTSSAAKGGLLYDVVNRRGEITERVQFPQGVVLVGFGPGGVVYLNRIAGDVGFLERAKIR